MSTKKESGLTRKNHLVIFDIALFFSLTFIGDYSIQGFPLFYVFWLCLFARRGLALSKHELVLQIILFLSFLPVVARPSLYVPQYYIASVYPALYISAISFSSKSIGKLKEDRGSINLLKSILLVVFISLASITINSSGLRNSIVFGPNVYYRVIGFLSILYLFLFNETFKLRKQNKSFKYFLFNLAPLIIVMLSSFFCLIKTNSRGAVFVMLTITLIMMSILLRLQRKWLIQALFSIIAISSVSFVFFNALIFNLFNGLADFTSELSSSRISNFEFGQAGSSFGAREYFYSLLPKFFSEGNFLLGGGNDYIQSETNNTLFYPHNLYLDALYNQGVVIAACFILCSLYALLLIIGSKVDPSMQILAGMLLPTYIGSQFSGTIYDNYSVISLIFFVSLSSFLKKRRKREVV